MDIEQIDMEKFIIDHHMKEKLSLLVGTIISIWHYFKILHIDAAQLEKAVGVFVYGALGGAGTWVGLKLVKYAVKYLGNFWRYFIYKIKK